jgi:hypothetical protein
MSLVLNSDPPTGLQVITADDVTAIPDLNGRKCRGIWIGTGGNINVTVADGSSAIIPNVQNGTLLPGFFTFLRATSTTASGFVAVY